MKVRFVFMTKAKGLMVHLIPDVMYIEPSDNSRAIVIGVLNMHLSFKFKKKKKTEEDTICYQMQQLNSAWKKLGEEITKTQLVQAIVELGKQMDKLEWKGGEQ